MNLQLKASPVEMATGSLKEFAENSLAFALGPHCEEFSEAFVELGPSQRERSDATVKCTLRLWNLPEAGSSVEVCVTAPDEYMAIEQAADISALHYDNGLGKAGGSSYFEGISIPFGD